MVLNVRLIITYGGNDVEVKNLQFMPPTDISSTNSSTVLPTSALMNGAEVLRTAADWSWRLPELASKPSGPTLPWNCLRVEDTMTWGVSTFSCVHFLLVINWGSLSRMPLQEAIDTFSYLISELDKLGIAYVCLVRYLTYTDSTYDGMLFSLLSRYI